MRYHLIAIGGSVMHNVALDLHDQGHRVTGSDDEIYQPSRGRLESKGLLPKQMGWDASTVTKDIDAIILGKHAKEDNPELYRAQQLDIPIYSFPEFVAKSCKATRRVAITGSHGKTSTTAMIMHVLKRLNHDFDYLVGAQLEGFDKMVSLTGADLLVVEGDEYPSSCLDNRAKMLHYEADISIITGVAWDHVNIYKTYDDYLGIFHAYLEGRGEQDTVFFDMTDTKLTELATKGNYACTRVGYRALDVNKKFEVIIENQAYPIKIFGQHNLKNLQAARLVCSELGIGTKDFMNAIQDFSGASKRLELMVDRDDLKIYRDFAHAPSKAKATAEAVASRYPDKKITAVLELHTFSSLDGAFISNYSGSLNSLATVAVYYDPHTLKSKGMPDLDPKEVEEAFDHQNLVVITRSEDLSQFIDEAKTQASEVLLIMSSGNLGGIDIGAVFT